MDTDDISQLVKFVDTLVFEKTGTHLKDIEQDLLQQVLEGKLLKHLRYGDYSNEYIQKFIIRDLWKLLSQVTDKKVGKKNVEYVLIKLLEARSHSSTAPCIQTTTQTETETSQTDRSDETNSESTTFNLSNFKKFIKPGVPLLLSLGIVVGGLGVSRLFNWYGVKNHLAGELPEAQIFYSLAGKINPDSPAIHQNKGAMYEDLGSNPENYRKAHAEYQKAIASGLIEAYNSEARLYIREGKFDAAIDILRIGLPLAKDEDLKYTMLKNRAWARLGQGYYDDAKQDLEHAMQLKQRESTTYCLMAQVLEGKKDNRGALVQWEKCLAYAYEPKLPEEDKWIHLAQQRLERPGSKP